MTFLWIYTNYESYMELLSLHGVAEESPFLH